MNLKKQLKKNGFIHIPEVINLKEVSTLREYINKRFIEIDNQATLSPKRFMTPSQVINSPEIFKICFNNKIVSSLKEVLGENYYILNDFQVQRNMFGVGSKKGWHVDSGSEAGADYLHRNDYKFLKCGVYLQDNTIEWGGGIDILPKGHKFPLKTYIKRIDFNIKNWDNNRRIKKDALLVPIKAGDFVAFDSRIPHTSTFPTKLESPHIENHCILNMPLEKYKYVIYWNSTSQKFFADKFLSNSERRAKEEVESTKNSFCELYFIDYLRYYHPNSFPNIYNKLASENGVNIASLSKEKSIFWENKYNEIHRYK